MYKHTVRAWWLLVMTACGRIGFDASDGGGTSGDTGATIDAALAIFSRALTPAEIAAF